MKYFNYRSQEYENEMRDYLNYGLKEAKDLGLYKDVNRFCIPSGKLVLSNLHSSGPKYHHVINFDFPVGTFPATIYQDTLQSILVKFRETDVDSLIALKQVHITPFEGDIIKDDYYKIEPDLKEIEFKVNGPAISLMDIGTLKDYTIKKKQNPADTNIIAVDSFTGATDAEKVVKLGSDKNAILAKPFYGNGIYFAWVGINLADELEFLLVDLHMVYTNTGEIE